MGRKLELPLSNISHRLYYYWNYSTCTCSKNLRNMVYISLIEALLQSYYTLYQIIVIRILVPINWITRRIRLHILTLLSSKAGSNLKKRQLLFSSCHKIWFSVSWWKIERLVKHWLLYVETDTPWFSHYSTIKDSLFQLPIHTMTFIVLQFQSNTNHHQCPCTNCCPFKMTV